MQLTVLAGGVGGARFLRGVRAVLPELRPTAADAQAAPPASAVTAVVNTADDITLFGLRVSPDLDTVMYTLGGGSDEERGWGRADETFHARDELAAYGAQQVWFGLGDRDIATHLMRTQMLDAGYPLSEVTAALCARWPMGVRMLPMTNARAETHIVIEDPDAPAGRRAVHFQEYWVRWHAAPPALEVVVVGIEDATPAPGVLEAMSDADVVLLAPSNPVVSIGPILGVAGVRAALQARSGPVIGISPIIAGAPVRGMADKMLSAIGVPTDAAAVAQHYGARSRGGILDGWLVDESDAAAVGAVRSAGIECVAVPLLMTDVAAASDMVRAALQLVGTAGA